MRCAKQAGLDVDEIGSRLSFFFGIGMSFYVEVLALLADGRGRLCLPPRPTLFAVVKPSFLGWT